MDIRELEDKKNYLNNLRPYSEAELEQIKINFILSNTYNQKAYEYALSETEKIFILENELQIFKDRVLEHYCHELIGIYNIYDFIVNLVEEKQSTHAKSYEELIKEINKIVLAPCCVPKKSQKGKYFKFYLFYQIGIALRMKRLIQWYKNTDCDFISKLAIFHLKFEEIHPFYDGNGRTGRMLMNLELAQHGYPMIGLKYDDIDLYKDAFKEYDKTKNHNQMQHLIYDNLDKQINSHIKIKMKQN